MLRFTRPWLNKMRSVSTYQHYLRQQQQQQQVTEPLRDLFGRDHTYLRISLTERCNLRCQYCMPAEGVKLTKNDKLLTTEEIIYLSRLFAEQGVRKIRLTGGEPTIRKDLPLIIENLKSIKGIETVAMTTNGLVLTKQLVTLQRSGLDIINISLDTLKRNKYELITRRNGWERVMMGIDLALQLGYQPVKINCVVMKDFNEDEIVDFVEFTRDRNVDVRFIEYMPFTGNRWDVDKMITYRDMVDKIKEKYPDFVALPNQPNDTSKAWKVPGFAGQVGFITSMTEHFCHTCNRLRITADGNLKVCLFGNKEVSLRDAIRNNCKENDLIALISAAVKRKKKQHADKIQINPHIYRLIPPPPPPPLSKLTIRYYSTNCNISDDNKNFSHVDEDGQANMVDVSDKSDTLRIATAEAFVKITPKIADLIRDNLMKKGDVLSVAQLAGIMGAKKTSDLIPLCHNIPLTHINVIIELQHESQEIRISSKVTTTGKTGVEMEALTACCISALTVYDMCKSVSHGMKITNIVLVEKTGGKSNGSGGGWQQKRSINLREMEGAPIQPGHVTVGHF